MSLNQVISELSDVYKMKVLGFSFLVLGYCACESINSATNIDF